MSAAQTRLTPEALVAHIQQQLSAGFQSRRRYVVALSGGADSVALLHLLAHSSLKPQLQAVHVNHGLQTIAGDWQVFCEQLCRDLAVPLQTHQVQFNQAEAAALGLEAAARNTRYEYLLKNLGANDVLLTAHHRGDQLETVLFRLERGTGLQGLAGIPALSQRGECLLLRPLLGFAKTELTGYLQACGQRWVEDPSNQSSEFRRNVYRHEYLPQLSAELCELLLDVSSKAAEVNAAIAQRHDAWLALRVNDEGTGLNLLPEDYAAASLLLERLKVWFKGFGFALPNTVLSELLRQSKLGTAMGVAPSYKHDRYEIWLKRRSIVVLRR